MVFYQSTFLHYMLYLRLLPEHTTDCYTQMLKRYHCQSCSRPASHFRAVQDLYMLL